jgi:hypothetical protein
MSASNGHRRPGAGDTVAVARPMMLVRYRPGVTVETARTVHVARLPTDGQAGVVGALCGAVLMLHDMQTVIPGEVMPCTICVLTLVTSTPTIGKPLTDNPDNAGTGLAAGGIGIAYQRWGGPVTLHGDQVRLNLYRDVWALTMPIPLCTVIGQLWKRGPIPHWWWHGATRCSSSA